MNNQTIDCSFYDSKNWKKRSVHIFYQVEGCEEWEICEQTFSSLEWASRKSVLKTLDELRERMLNLDIEISHQELIDEGLIP